MNEPREILFRGKLEFEEGWAYGYYVGANHSAPYHEIFEPADAGGWNWKRYVVDPSTVGQYTGKNDKSSKRVFEQDIIRIFGCETSPDVIGVVAWENHDQCFVVLAARHPLDETVHIMDFGNLGDSMYFEIIGNIHDNPELLEGKRDEI